MADFPANNRSSSSVDGVVVFGCIALFLVLCGWITSFSMLIHGAVTKDIWEVVSGAILLAILLVVRAVLK